MKQSSIATEASRPWLTAPLNRPWLAVAVVTGMLIFPLAFGAYPVRLAQEIAVWGLFAMSLDLLMGHTGMVSFGHGAFFGIGGYIAAWALPRAPTLISALLLPLLGGALAAAVIGFFCVRASGVYFIMLTLAFSQMFYAVAFQTAALGAEDGIVGVPRPGDFGTILAQPTGFHAYVVVVMAVAAYALLRIERSPFGHVLHAIQQNEMRLSAVGYAVRRYNSWRSSSPAPRRRSPVRSTPKRSGRSRPTHFCGRLRVKCFSWSSSAAPAPPSVRRWGRRSSFSYRRW